MQFSPRRSFQQHQDHAVDHRCQCPEGDDRPGHGEHLRRHTGDESLGLEIQRWGPYTTLAAVPNTITGPATVNILTAVPVTMPSGCVKIDIQFFRNFFSCLQSGGRLLF